MDTSPRARRYHISKESEKWTKVRVSREIEMESLDLKVLER
jgi:hypothetical protein